MGAIADIVEQIRDELDATTRRAGRLQAALDALLAEEGAPATVPAPPAPAAPEPEPEPEPAAKVTPAARPAPVNTTERHRIKPKRALREALTTEEWDEIARVANEAIAEGESAARAVAAHFGINLGAAQQRISAARKRGYEISFVHSGRGARSAEHQPRSAAATGLVTVDEAAALLESLPA